MLNKSFDILLRRKNLTIDEKVLLKECIESGRYKEFYPNWHVDIYKHKCGHKEIIAHPRLFTKVAVKQDALRHKCSKCSVGDNNTKVISLGTHKGYTYERI